MSTRALLFADADAGREPRQFWHEALFVPLGSDSAISRYCRLIAGKCRPTELILPQSLAAELPSGSADFSIQTFEHSFANACFGRGHVGETCDQTLLLDVSRLPAIDVNAALDRHRSSGAAMTVFCSCRQADYCMEQMAWDCSGAVKSTVRRYSDSARWQCGGRPIAVILSRRTVRLDADTPIHNFVELADHLAERVRRAGDRFCCSEYPAIRSHSSPMEALLWVIEQSATEVKLHRLAAEGLVPPGVRLYGPICFGKDINISAGAMIVGPSALGDSSFVGTAGVVSRSIILPGQSVADYGHCHKQVVGPGGELFEQPSSALNLQRDSNVDPQAPAIANDRIKRLFDICIASAALVLLSPLLVITGLAVRLSSRGPVLFRHRRQGLGGVEFDCLKFRTMFRNADALQSQLRGSNEVDGPQFKISCDPRTTGIGRWLRRTNIDELPQLFNVLCGHMSLVGPRPSPDSENQCCPTWRKLRLSVRPGITGLWQVARSSDRRMNGFQEWVYYDTRYVENRSMSLDLQIIWQTLRILTGLGISARWHRRWHPQHEEFGLGRGEHTVATARLAV